MEIPMIMQNCETLTPEQYLKLSDQEKSNIINTIIIPPQLGSPNFGMIQVQYKTPIYSRMGLSK